LEPSTYTSGQVIGSYKILQLLGEGGMGQVFLAERLYIGGRVALKVLHHSFAHHPEMAGRFLNEARAANSIEHAGVVKVYEYGRLPDGGAFIAMEYLEGQSLRQRLTQRPVLPIEMALRIARQMAAALSAAHAQRIVHRDLKPDNVMLVEDSEAPGGERAKILDFGIAKLLWELHQGDSHTKTGTFMGTPVYMPPEQCRDTKSVGPKADVYALGAILYEMLCGQPPFGVGTAMELAVRIVTEEPAPLHERAPGVPPPVSALVHSLLAKDPSRRPTMAEVTTRLRQLSDSMVGEKPAPHWSTEETMPLLRPRVLADVIKELPTQRPKSGEAGTAAPLKPAAIEQDLLPSSSIAADGARSDATPKIPVVRATESQPSNAANDQTAGGVKSLQQQPAFALEPKGKSHPGRSLRRRVLLGVTGILCVGIPLAVFVPQWRLDAEGKRSLQAIEGALRAEDWQEARTMADRLIADRRFSETVRSKASTQRRHAEEQEENQLLLLKLESAAQRGEAEKVIALFPRFSQGSLYRERGHAVFLQMLPRHVEQRLEGARTARSEGRCGDFAQVIKELLALAPSDDAVRQLDGAPCPEVQAAGIAAVAAVAPAVAGSAPPPVSVPVSAETAQRRTPVAGSNTPPSTAGVPAEKAPPKTTPLQTVQAAMARGNYGQAITLARTYAKTDPSMWSQVGEAACRMHDPQQAKDAVERLPPERQQRLIDVCKQLGVIVGLDAHAPQGVDVEQQLSAAHTDFLNGNYRKAITLARSLVRASPARAWRIVGASACSLKDLTLANEALRSLDASGRNYLTYACRARGVETVNGQFVASD
jgi:serine/threonine protein kinase